MLKTARHLDTDEHGNWPIHRLEWPNIYHVELQLIITVIDYFLNRDSSAS